MNVFGAWHDFTFLRFSSNRLQNFDFVSFLHENLNVITNFEKRVFPLLFCVLFPEEISQNYLFSLPKNLYFPLHSKKEMTGGLIIGVVRKIFFNNKTA